MSNIDNKNKFFILREIYENNDISRDKICYKYNITYCQFDAILNELYIEDKFIDKYSHASLSFKITEEGQKYLDIYRVDGAVILASGLGSRMGDITKDTSKCLLKIKDEILVERLIKQFKERGIEDITVLIGYCKEQFYYLKDKYSVNLVENKEYNVKNTIASFYHVIDKIEGKNTYISVGDIYLSENPFHLYEIEPYYIGPYLEDCSMEWVYKYDINGKVSGVADGQICDYYLGGYSFHTKEFSKELCKLVRNTYHKENTGHLYWENLLVDNFSSLPDFYMHKLPYGVLNEFDSAEDFIKSQSMIDYAKDVLKYILKCNSIDEFKIINLNDGYTNFNYKVDYKNNEYVLRIPGIASKLFIDRKVEREIYEKIDRYDISDKLCYFDDNGIKLSKYFKNAKAIDINNENELLNAMKLYHKLHTIQDNVDYDISITKVYRRYLEMLDKYKLRFMYDNVEDFQSIQEKCEKIISFIDTYNRPKVLCHGDAASVNVLMSDNNYKLIDFEYAGMADPLTDIALFSVFSDFNIEKVKNVFDMYIENAAKDDKTYDDKSKYISLITAYMAIDSIACVLCEIIRTSITQIDFKNFCNNRVSLFNKCYDSLFY